MGKFQSGITGIASYSKLLACLLILVVFAAACASLPDEEDSSDEEDLYSLPDTSAPDQTGNDPNDETAYYEPSIWIGLPSQNALDSSFCPLPGETLKLIGIANNVAPCTEEEITWSATGSSGPVDVIAIADTNLNKKLFSSFVAPQYPCESEVEIVFPEPGDYTISFFLDQGDNHLEAELPYHVPVTSNSEKPYLVTDPIDGSDLEIIPKRFCGLNIFSFEFTEEDTNLDEFLEDYGIESMFCVDLSTIPTMNYDFYICLGFPCLDLAEITTSYNGEVTTPLKAGDDPRVEYLLPCFATYGELITCPGNTLEVEFINEPNSVRFDELEMAFDLELYERPSTPTAVFGVKQNATSDPWETARLLAAEPDIYSALPPINLDGPLLENECGLPENNLPIVLYKSDNSMLPEASWAAEQALFGDAVE